MIHCSQPIMLTQEEIKEITCASTKDAQVKELKHWRIPFRINRKGWPIVLRSDAERVMTLNRIYALTQNKETDSPHHMDQPDFSRIR